MVSTGYSELSSVSFLRLPRGSRAPLLGLCECSSSDSTDSSVGMLSSVYNVRGVLPARVTCLRPVWRGDVTDCSLGSEVEGLDLIAFSIGTLGLLYGVNWTNIIFSGSNGIYVVSAGFCTDSNTRTSSGEDSGNLLPYFDLRPLGDLRCGVEILTSSSWAWIVGVMVSRLILGLVWAAKVTIVFSALGRLGSNDKILASNMCVKVIGFYKHVRTDMLTVSLFYLFSYKTLNGLFIIEYFFWREVTIYS